jgi:hypothetical protein
MNVLPQTKISDLLQAYPQLEVVLIALDPKFKELQNPWLRNSIGKVATLERAALVSGIPTTTLIEHLREATILCNRDGIQVILQLRDREFS